MSDPIKPNPPGRTLPDEIAAASGLPSGSAAGSLHAVGAGGTDRPPPGSLDPHAKPQDFSLRPDPAGVHDPLGAGNTDPHARTASFDHTLSGATRQAQDAASQAASQAADKASGLADQARDKATDLAGQARDRASDLAGQAQGRAADLADSVKGAAQDARERAADVYDDARTWVSDMGRTHRRRVEDVASRGRDQLHQGRTAVEQFVTENPLLVGVVGVAAGLLLGALLPRTRQEDRNLGPYADELRDQGLRYARDVTSRGREFVESALDPDNLNAAAQRAGVQGEPAGGYQGSDRTAHRL
ncbi:hypothetical protein [Methylobacterium planeticum]|uniref:hypothetical protein n=1 Tax=Methylobacterium planeticum TaxID=2615211 RepID=UPI001783BB35|nr:hypothetical protein [Methylobacterium planeticum]